MELVDFKEELYQNLRDPEYAALYLQSAYEDSYAEFFHAVRELAIAHGGIQAVADKIGRGRCSLYKSLSREGHPRFETVDGALKQAGFRIVIMPTDFVGAKRVKRSVLQERADKPRKWVRARPAAR